MMKRTLLHVEELERREVPSAAGLTKALLSPGAAFRSEQATVSLTRNLERVQIPGNPVVPPGLLTALASPGADHRSEHAFFVLTENVARYIPPNPVSPTF